MHDKKGLLYGLLDSKGRKTGVPIKASSIYGKPTLPYLEKQFKLNEALRQPHKQRLKDCIDKVLSSPSQSREDRGEAFLRALKKENIFVLFRKNEEGRTYGVTFVDNKTKVVFNGSDLGKAYSAKSILDRLSVTRSGASTGNVAAPTEAAKQYDPDLGFEKLASDLLTAKAFDHTSPDAAMKRRRRKRRKGRSL